MKTIIALIFVLLCNFAYSTLPEGENALSVDSKLHEALASRIMNLRFTKDPRFQGGQITDLSSKDFLYANLTDRLERDTKCIERILNIYGEGISKSVFPEIKTGTKLHLVWSQHKVNSPRYMIGKSIESYSGIDQFIQTLAEMRSAISEALHDLQRLRAPEGVEIMEVRVGAEVINQSGESMIADVYTLYPTGLLIDKRARPLFNVAMVIPRGAIYTDDLLNQQLQTAFNVLKKLSNLITPYSQLVTEYAKRVPYCTESLGKVAYMRKPCIESYRYFAGAPESFNMEFPRSVYQLLLRQDPALEQILKASRESGRAFWTLKPELLAAAEEGYMLAQSQIRMNLIASLNRSETWIQYLSQLMRLLKDAGPKQLRLGSNKVAEENKQNLNKLGRGCVKFNEEELYLVLARPHKPVENLWCERLEDGRWKFVAKFRDVAEPNHIQPVNEVAVPVRQKPVVRDLDYLAAVRNEVDGTDIDRTDTNGVIFKLHNMNDEDVRNIYISENGVHNQKFTNFLQAALHGETVTLGFPNGYEYRFLKEFAEVLSLQYGINVVLPLDCKGKQRLYMVCTTLPGDWRGHVYFVDCNRHLVYR